MRDRVQQIENKEKHSSVLSSLLWKFLNGGSAQVIQLVVSIIVARLLLPADFGVVALLLVFTTIANVFVQSGLGTAVIQQKEISQIELSSVFYYTFAVASILYVALYVSAPLIEEFYAMEGTSKYLRILALILFPGSFNTIQNALVARRMLWKSQCVCNVISVFLSGAIGIILAYLGMGAWAIIFQQLSCQIILCLGLTFVVKWWPSIRFSVKKTIPLLRYGINLLGANLIDTLYHNLESLIIGKKFPSEVLAFFTKGRMFPLVVTNNVDGALQTVMLPVLSRKQDSIQDLKVMLRKSISTSTFILYGSLTILALCAEPMIRILLGENWLSATPFVQLYCVIGMFFPLQTSSAQAINAIGLSQIYLKIMSIKRVIGVTLLFVFTILFDSVYAIVIAALLAEMVSIILHIYYNYRLLSYSIKEQVSDVYKNIIGVLVPSALYCLVSSSLPSAPFVAILILGLGTLIIYIMTLKCLRSSDLEYIVNRFGIVKREK